MPPGPREAALCGLQANQFCSEKKLSSGAGGRVCGGAGARRAPGHVVSEASE